MFNQPTALRSVLNPKYLEHVLSDQYDIGSWEECLFWLRGLNDTYRVRTSSGMYILRVYRTEITEVDVQYELSLLSQLKGILGSSVHTDIGEHIEKKDHTEYTVLEAAEGKRVAVMFRYIEGIENNLEDEESCYAFGQSAAELHKAMDQVVLEQPRYELDTKFLIDEPLERIINYIGEKNEASSFLHTFARALKERIGVASKLGLDNGLCHGDMHGNNNAFQQGSQFIHYDFEWAANGWRAYDLAQVKARKRQSGEQKEVLWSALIAGYRSVRSFSAEDEQAVDLFIIARRFWVMGLDVAFIESDMGALDYGSDWLNSFVEEFRDKGIV
ncbi:phosphotransferase [Paenibacillus sp. FSL F4-0087]|uniref:phosphotransferase n=1 Tax=unclassified Paenibacillus TaxID=185978 RepID=UPI00096CAD91|nr:phosphotransferase [Paenibacillus sp. LK1]OME77566.1 aminoglycoside phosphotransferase [Paenibacillus pabuli]PIH55983.1 aminoglycoside phosphotransferase [Paenibacillus sp. LK1]